MKPTTPTPEKNQNQHFFDLGFSQGRRKPHLSSYLGWLSIAFMLGFLIGQYAKP